jgi:hypothetical protein
MEKVARKKEVLPALDVEREGRRKAPRGLVQAREATRKKNEKSADK